MTTPEPDRAAAHIHHWTKSETAHLGFWQCACGAKLYHIPGSHSITVEPAHNPKPVNPPESTGADTLVSRLKDARRYGKVHITQDGPDIVARVVEVDVASLDEAIERLSVAPGKSTPLGQPRATPGREAGDLGATEPAPSAEVPEWAVKASEELFPVPAADNPWGDIRKTFRNRCAEVFFRHHRESGAPNENATIISLHGERIACSMRVALAVQGLREDADRTHDALSLVKEDIAEKDQIIDAKEAELTSLRAEVERFVEMRKADTFTMQHGLTVIADLRQQLAATRDALDGARAALEEIAAAKVNVCGHPESSPEAMIARRALATINSLFANGEQDSGVTCKKNIPEFLTKPTSPEQGAGHETQTINALRKEQPSTPLLK